ncbi:MAG: metallophosphoesterase family protein [Saprospiraceae bacterium]|nr:metallophosphoesterase family protein [Saprospiraceae bacterium]
MNEREFPITLLLFMLVVVFSCKQVPEEEAASDKYRLVWNSDPTNSVTLAWDQLQDSEVEVYFDTKDQGRKYWKYNQKVSPSANNNRYEMNTHFANLEGLQPGTNYFFVVKDTFGVSDRFWFKTAPSKPSPFTFITGGDTKSEGLPLEAGRASNGMVSKLRPLFVMFNGDFTSGRGTDAKNWQQWLTDWHSLTTTSDGLMIPIFPVHGNHENGDKGNLSYIFNTPYHDSDSSRNYYSLTLGGNQVHLISLNTEIETGGAQKQWLEKDLRDHEDCTFKIAGYHKPFRPHTAGKRENDYQYDQWVWLFDKYGLDLSFDGDSHMHKITFPIKPDSSLNEVNMGFRRDNENGTMYVGEGSWGAKPRVNDDDKPWTIASGSFNQIKWVHIFPTRENTPSEIDIYTVVTATYDSIGNQNLVHKDVVPLRDENLFDIPENITLFGNNGFGKIVKYPFHLNRP